LGALAIRKSADGQNEQGLPSRLRVCWKVRAITDSEVSFVTCVVVDVSSGGARLSVPAGAELPQRFTLQCPLRGLLGQVEVKWRGVGELGVAFVDPDGFNVANELGARADPQSDRGHLIARLAELESEISQVKSLLLNAPQESI
jgi:hypothetical protein